MRYQLVSYLSVSVLAALQTQEPGIPTEHGRKLLSTNSDNNGGLLMTILWILGLTLIPFSLALLWKNEKKVVRYHQVIEAALKVLKMDQNFEKVDEANEKALVHMNGTARNLEVITDSRLDYSRQNCYRVIRTVEMFQCVEKVLESKRNGKVSRTYEYNNKWVEHFVDSRNFNDETKRALNPNVEWPFFSCKHEASQVLFGTFRLSPE